MELGDIIKWIDETNLHLEKWGDDDFKEKFDHTRQKAKDGSGYVCEFEQYIEAVTVQLYNLDKENKKAFIRRLFRWCDFGFAEYTCYGIEEKDWYGKAWERMSDVVLFGEKNIPDLGFALYIDIFAFYDGILKLCFECEINPTEIAPKCKIMATMIKWTESPYNNTRSISSLTLESYIIKDKKRVIKAIDAKLDSKQKANSDGEGRLVALIICALERYGYMNLEGKDMTNIINAFRAKYPNKIGKRQGISSYITATRTGEYCRGYKPISSNEIDDFINNFIARNKLQ